MDITGSTFPSELGVIDGGALEAGLETLPKLQLVSPYDLKPLSIDIKSEGLLIGSYENLTDDVIQYVLGQLKDIKKEQHRELMNNPRISLFFSLILCASSFNDNSLPVGAVRLEERLKRLNS